MAEFGIPPHLFRGELFDRSLIHREGEHDVHQEHFLYHRLIYRRRPICSYAVN